ncbi:aldo/keto reductase [Philodulcilactobacillus myokoensis]|uniref:Aldo/keto reductase n=1 Tax=Philodulcilactobacillus myokoensis TaxID=2929573 RepID=A0A9W6B293_9LACO|nr:aldo/keto reductase [Philodulcilactobacillus myokoensis]GLB47328.1 aldo/keto reductase [Philodulcilactobacillus myokoensis]
MTELNAANAGTYKFDDDFVVNRLGYGTMQLTGPGVFGPFPDKQKAIDVIKEAPKLGINLIDTADSYGPWFADRYLGEALREMPDKGHSIHISEKVGQLRHGPGIWIPFGDPKYLRQEVESSLLTLGRDHEELLFLHRWDTNVPLSEQLGVLQKMKEEGKIKHIGVSQFSVDDLKAAQKYADIDAVENLYNVGNHKDDDVVDYAEKHHMAFLPWFPLDTGKLAGANSPLDKIAKKYNASSAQIALAWLLKRSPNILPIPGTSNVDHLKDNVAAANVKLSDDDFKTLSNLQK